MDNGSIANYLMQATQQGFLGGIGAALRGSQYYDSLYSQGTSNLMDQRIFHSPLSNTFAVMGKPIREKFVDLLRLEIQKWHGDCLRK